jgi:hypothetical protein
MLSALLGLAILLGGVAPNVAYAGGHGKGGKANAGQVQGKGKKGGKHKGKKGGKHKGKKGGKSKKG